QQLHHRAEVDVLCHLRGRGDKDLLAGSHAQLAAVVLSEVKAAESRFVGHLDELEPVLEQLARGSSADVLDVVEDSELRSGHLIPPCPSFSVKNPATAPSTAGLWNAASSWLAPAIISSVESAPASVSAACSRWL